MANNDIVFKEISLRLPGEDYVNIIDQFQSSSTFGGMSIDEGLFDNGISGFIILNDPDPTNNSANLPSITTLAKTGAMIRFSFSTQIGTSIETNIRELEFYVYSVSIVSDISPGIAKLGSSQSVSYRLEFSSYESTAINYETVDVFPENADYVGTISEFVDELASPDKLGILGPSPEEDDSGNIIRNTTQVPPEIFTTYNGVWFKRKQSLYPWGKEKTVPSLSTLISASLNYAIPAIGQQINVDGEIVDRGIPHDKNLSYVFYQSLPQGRWKLVPIGGEIEEENTEAASLYKRGYVDGSENDGYHTYRFTMDETQIKRIEMFKLIKDTDRLELEEAGVFGSSYRLIEPNYRGIYNGIVADGTGDNDESEVHENSITGTKNNLYYHDAMSIASHLKQEEVVYSYNEFFSGGEEDVSNPLLGKSPLEGRENPSFSSITDTVYGYFDSSYLYKPFTTKNDDYSSARGSKHMWQTMFDMCDLPLITNETTGEIGIDSIIKARDENKRGRLAYSVLSDLKEQWNRYRHSVCCDSAEGGEKFLAMLVGATSSYPLGEEEDVDRNHVPFAITGGVTVENLYRYSFVEVDVWPRVLVPEGATAGSFGITGAALDGVTFSDYDTFTYYDYISQKDINPSTGEREIYIGGNSAGTEGLTLTFGLTQAAEGQDYAINQEQEFFVIPVDGGRRGLFTAYNTNELVNNIAFTGAGINMKGFNYPSGFNLMPIGGMTSGQGGESDTSTTFIPPTYMGSVVEMSSINNQLVNIKTNTDAAVIEYTPPEGVVESGPDAVVGILNNIMGTKNLPSTFAGASAELLYINPSSGEIKEFDRDDIEERPKITDDAKPQPVSGSPLEKSQTTVYLFSSENDHDGRCST